MLTSQPSDKLIKNAQVKSIYAHEIKEFVKPQQNKVASINEIKTKKAAAQRTRADIQKLNLEPWATLKESVKSGTVKWKNLLVRNDWCNIGPYWKLDKLGLPRQIEKVEQPI